MQLLKGWKFDEIERILSLTKKANSYSDVQLKISIPKKIDWRNVDQIL